MLNVKTLIEPFAIVLVGLPASGKSTWCNKFLSRSASFSNEVCIISSDNYIQEKALAEGSTYTEVFDKYIGAATAHMKTQCNLAVKEGKNLIWDQTNLSPKKRKSVINRLPDTYLKVAVIFDIDDRELQRRLDTRAEEEGKFIPPHVMKSMLASYRPVTKDEGFNFIIKGN